MNVIFVQEIGGIYLQKKTEYKLTPYEYSQFFLENGTSEYDVYDFEFMISSSVLSGHYRPQYYFAINKDANSNGSALECILHNNEYACQLLRKPIYQEKFFESKKLEKN